MIDINNIKYKINVMIKYLNLDYLINYIFQILYLIIYQDNEREKKINSGNNETISDLENQFDNRDIEQLDYRDIEQIENSLKLKSIKTINNRSIYKESINNRSYIKKV